MVSILSKSTIETVRRDVNQPQSWSNMTHFERLFQVMTKPWVLIFFCVLMVFSYVWVDKPLAIYIDSLGLKESQPWLRLLTNAGLGLFYTLFFAVVALICRFGAKNKRWEYRAWFLWLCVVIPSLVCVVIKCSLGRARPDMLFSHDLYGFYGPHLSSVYWSFPSGHTTTIMGVMLGLSALFPRFCFGFIFSGAIIAISRILLTKHYLSDVLCASYLTLIEVGLMYYWMRKKNILL